jgi:hypothetical protein
MSKLQKIIIAVLVVFLLAGIVATVFVIFSSKQKLQNNTVVEIEKENFEKENIDDDFYKEENTLPIGSEIEPIQPRQQKQMTENEKENAFLIKTANAFVERYGSYSNQSNYENLRDLFYFMAKDFRQESEAKVNANRYVKKEIYYGVTTYVLDSDIKQKSGDECLVEIKTQRQEFFGGEQNNKTSYKNVIVGLEKESGVWKVNSVNWQ